jgi:hypothetical protein
MADMSRFLEKKLKLKVNQGKSSFVAAAAGLLDAPSPPDNVLAAMAALSSPCLMPTLGLATLAPEEIA